MGTDNIVELKGTGGVSVLGLSLDRKQPLRLCFRFTVSWAGSILDPSLYFFNFTTHL